MKTTYLIKSIQSDGSSALVETTAEHWHKITENNKGLSKDERRYFITDIISESGNLDCMIIEVAYRKGIPAQPEPSNGACHWDIPTTMERYVHVTSKSLVDAVQPFEQSHGSVEIPTPFWCKNGVQK